jgi:hypothetical protein
MFSAERSNLPVYIIALSEDVENSFFHFLIEDVWKQQGGYQELQDQISVQSKNM